MTNDNVKVVKVKKIGALTERETVMLGWLISDNDLVHYDNPVAQATQASLREKFMAVMVQANPYDEDNLDKLES